MINQSFNYNNIIIEGVEYEGTEGLWRLIILEEPYDYTEDDYLNYIELLAQTNTIYQGNDPNRNNPKSSSSNK